MDRRRGDRPRPHGTAPVVDPLTVRFTALLAWTLAIPGFDDDPAASDESKLEAIQMAWYEEWQDVQ